MDNYYYYIDSQGQQMGPADLSSLKKAHIQPDTLVWHPGMPQWRPAKEITELQQVFQQTPPPPYETSRPPVPPLYESRPQQPQNTSKPQNWLWLGICTTLLCCLPLGIVSIVYANKVDSLWSMGDYKGATESAEKAKMWGFISAGVGVVSNILLFIIAIAAS